MTLEKCGEVQSKAVEFRKPTDQDESRWQEPTIATPRDPGQLTTPRTHESAVLGHVESAKPSESQPQDIHSVFGVIHTLSTGYRLMASDAGQ